MAEEIYIGGGGGGGGGNANITIGGNTSGTLTLISTGTVTFAGGNNITLSQVGNAITISGAANTGATTFQAGVSNIGNTLGVTGTHNNMLVLAGGNNVTLSQSVNGQSMTVTISGANAGGAQTGISGIAGSGASTVTAGTVQWANANNISFGLNGSTMTASYSQSIQTQGSVQINGSTGAISFNAGNNMSLSTVAGALTYINLLSSSLIAQNVSNVSSAGTLSSRFALADHAHIGVAGVNASGTASTFVGNLMLSGANLTLVTGGNSSAGSIGFSVAAQTAQTGISGIAGSGASTVTNGTVQFGNANNVSFGLNGSTMTASFSTAAQTVESQTMGMSNLGNTSGTSGVASGGQIRYLFAGGNNITLSQSVNGASATLTISGGAGGAFSGGVSTQGNTLGTTGTVNNGIVFVGGNNITLSQSSAAGGATVTISAPSGGGAGVSTGGNTAGTTGTVDYQLVFVGGSNISLSQSVNGSSGTITINGASGGGGGFQSAGISTGGNTAGTTGFASSQILFYGGANITLSQSLGGGNASLSIIGASGGGGALSVGNSTIGNTSGETGVFSNRVVLAGINNITLSGATNTAGLTMTISGPTGGGAGMGTGANTSGTSGTVGKELYVYGGANISLSQSVNGGSASLSIIGASGGTGGAGSVGIGVSTGGNTAGTTGLISGSSIQMLFVGNGAVSLSQSAAGGSATVTFNVPVQSTPINTVGMSNLGNTSGTSGVVTGNQIQYFLAGGTNITLSQSINGASGTVTISGANQTVQTQNSVQINGSSGTFSFNAGNNMSLSTVANNLTFINVLSSSGIAQNVSNVSSAGTQSSRYALADHAHIGLAGVNASGTASTFVGNLMLSGTNLTLVTGGNSSAGSIGFSVAAQTAQTGISGIAGSGASTVTNGTVQFANSNNISFGLNGSTMTASFSVTNAIPVIGTAVKGVSSIGSTGTITRYAPEDHQHAGVFSFGVSNIGNTVGNTTVFPGQFILSGGNNITLSQATAAGNLVTIGIAGADTHANIYNVVSASGNTTGTLSSQSTGTVVFAGGANITLSQSSNTITIIGGAGAAAATIGMTNTGNTSGTVFTTGAGTVYFQGTNNITVSNSTAANIQTLWISGPTGGGAGMGSGTNTSGTSGTVGKELYIYANNQLGLSQSVNGSSASLTINGEPLRSKFYWMPEGQVSSSAITMGSASFQPVMIPYDMSFTRVDIPLLIASTSSATTNTCALVISSGLVIYSISNNSTLNPITGSFGTTTHTFASNTAGNQSIAGARYASFALGTSLSAGWYVIGFQLSTANTSSVGLSTTAIPFAMSILLGSVFTGTGFADIGSASAATTDVPWGRGVANSTITATNATMNINGITQTGVSKFRGNFHVLFRAIS